MTLGQNSGGIFLSLAKQAFDDDEIFDETLKQIVMLRIKNPRIDFLIFQQMM